MLIVFGWHPVKPHPRAGVLSGVSRYIAFQIQFTFGRCTRFLPLLRPSESVGSSASNMPTGGYDGSDRAVGTWRQRPMVLRIRRTPLRAINGIKAVCGIFYLLSLLAPLHAQQAQARTEGQ